ncbi:MAG: SDR family NAD(P)-dependent oxidoreductase [Anaerolineales bacterium]
MSNSNSNSQPKLTALITGASRGLGLALARGLAERGWQLIIDARGAEALRAAETELSRMSRVVAIPGDITDAAHRRALAEAAQSLGGLDAVVNNAGILGPSPQPHLLDYPLEALEAVYRANVIAPLAVLQAVRDSLKPNARLINITSDAGVTAYASWGGYGSGKAALEQLSAVLAAENPQWRVYWVDPGDLRTQMHQEAFPGEDISDRPLPEVSVPGLVALLEGDFASGRYKAQQVGIETNAVQEIRVVLTVDDYDRAVALYRDGLRLPMTEQWDSPEGHGMVLAAGAATIELLDRREANRAEQIEAHGAAQRAEADPVRLALKVNDVEAASAGVAEHGARIVAPAILTPWGHLNQRVQAGEMQITFFHPLKDSEKAAA